jgi:hypothetical protein
VNGFHKGHPNRSSSRRTPKFFLVLPATLFYALKKYGCIRYHQIIYNYSLSSLAHLNTHDFIYKSCKKNEIRGVNATSLAGVLGETGELSGYAHENALLRHAGLKPNGSQLAQIAWQNGAKQTWPPSSRSSSYRSVSNSSRLYGGPSSSIRMSGSTEGETYLLRRIPPNTWQESIQYIVARPRRSTAPWGG